MLPLSSKARTGLISLAEQRLRLADLYCFGIAGSLQPPPSTNALLAVRSGVGLIRGRQSEKDTGIEPEDPIPVLFREGIALLSAHMSFQDDGFGRFGQETFDKNQPFFRSGSAGTLQSGPVPMTIGAGEGGFDGASGSLGRWL
jgi:hypothetical protein